MNWEAIITALIAVFVLPLIKYGLDELKKYLEAQVAKINDVRVTSVVYDAIETVYKVVLYVMQTYVDTLKSKGEFDALSQKEAFDMAKKRATELINDEAKEIIVDQYGSFDKWLEIQIEQNVRSLKK